MVRFSLSIAFAGLATLALAAPVPDEVLARLKNVDPNERVKALMALSKLGVEVVPHVIPLLADEDEDVRQGAVVCLSVLKADAGDVFAALKPAQKSETPEIRKGAARVVQQWVLRKRFDTKLALPLIETALADESVGVRQIVVAALIKCGPDGLPLLKTALKDEDAKVRAYAATTFKAITPPIPEGFDLLSARLKTETELPVRQTVIDALGVYGEQAVPVLLATLKEEDAPIRLAGLKTLAKLDAKSLAKLKPSLSAVREAVGAKEGPVRDAALGVLAAFGTDGQGALVEALASAQESEPRKAVLKVIASMSQTKLPPPKEVVSGAIAALGDEDIEVRALAALVLGEVGPAAKEALPALEKAMADAGQYKPLFEKAKASIGK